MAEKDATLRHYIELHPEDFPDPGEYPSIAQILLYRVPNSIFIYRTQKVLPGVESMGPNPLIVLS